jgi:hypothetical protein
MSLKTRIAKLEASRPRPDWEHTLAWCKLILDMQGRTPDSADPVAVHTMAKEMFDAGHVFLSFEEYLKLLD